jgi:hypothetical protein
MWMDSKDYRATYSVAGELCGCVLTDLYFIICLFNHLEPIYKYAPLSVTRSNLHSVTWCICLNAMLIYTRTVCVHVLSAESSIMPES